MAPAVAVPTAAETAADRARVEKAVDKLEASRKRSASLADKVERASAELDRVMADQERTSGRLGTRSVTMYRSGDTGLVSVLLSAATFEQFAARWDLLTRLNRQDAQNLRELAIARAKAEKSAKSLMELQAEEAKAVDATAREVARARKELSASQAALKEYEDRIAKSKASDSSPKKSSSKKTDSNQGLSGAGAWKSAVASHYGKNFTGRGASGKSIGPYSMMVAHETLPFHTLIEFEYNGKHCVASVEDRGPYSKGRSFDLGPGVVRALGFNGVHTVRYRVIKR